MIEIEINEPGLYRCQCKKCETFLSNPFILSCDAKVNNEEIKLERYKGDNINYHGENDYHDDGKILYSFIYCLKCNEKIGYWISQASIKQINNINHIFFFIKCINLIKYDGSKISKEEYMKFQQEDIFYNSKYLNPEVVKYAKEHIDNFINNVKKLEKERTDATFCYNSFERRIINLKDLFNKILKNEKKISLKLDFEFSKEQISKAKRRNLKRLQKLEKNVDISNGGKIEISREEQNGQNNDNHRNNDNNGSDKKNGGEINVINLNNIESDIYLEEKIKQKNNKEPSKDIKKSRKSKMNNLK